MVKQYVYIDTAAIVNGDLVKLINNDTLRLNINGLLSDLPPYALISLQQLELISDSDLPNGLVAKLKNGTSNQMNLNKTDSVLGVCTFEYTKGTFYHYKEPNVSFPLMISGNIQQIELYFANNDNVPIQLTNVSLCIVLCIESPDPGIPQAEYRRAIPL